jgi:hypothetical protein
VNASKDLHKIYAFSNYIINIYIYVLVFVKYIFYVLLPHKKHIYYFIILYP